MGDEALIEALNVVLTCAPGECGREAACLTVALKLRDLLAIHQPHVIAPEPEPLAVTAPVPTWECPGC